MRVKKIYRPIKAITFIYARLYILEIRQLQKGCSLFHCCQKNPLLKDFFKKSKVSSEKLLLLNNFKLFERVDVLVTLR